LTQQGKWTSDALEVIMDALEREQLSLRKTSKSLHILVTSFSDHLNGKIRSNKQGPQGALTNQKDEAFLA
jgi:hypothetical protein